VIQNPGLLLDHPQILITGSLCHARHSLIISERYVHNFLSYLANTQTNKQTNKNQQKHNLLGEGNNEHLGEWKKCQTNIAVNDPYNIKLC